MAAVVSLTVVAMFSVLVLTGAWGANREVCPGCPPAPEFVLGFPILATCPAGYTFAVNGCLAGDFVYAIPVAGSVVTFGDVLFHVGTRNATVYVATGGALGFSILNATSAIAAQYSAPGGAMSMTANWTFSDGTDASTPLSALFSIQVDMGSLDPYGQGYSFVVLVTGGASGSVSVSLP